MTRIACSRIGSHSLALALALGFTYAISRTALVQSAVQFVAPLGILLASHLVWRLLARDSDAGYAGRVLRDGATSAALLALGTVAAQLLLPMPAQANGVDLGGLLIFLFCLAVVAIIVGLLAGLIYLIYKGVRALFRRGRDGPNDLGTLAAVALLLAGVSLEGVPGAYQFDGAGRAEAVRRTMVPPAALWGALETATSPAFARPALLSGFPQPVAVERDEGTALGALRVVRMTGREGTGLVRLMVTERSVTHVRLSTQSDSSPLRNWIGIKAITYRVTPESHGATLSVSLDFERRLAPAWFFAPMMRGAGRLAMDVLARDVVQRAEASLVP